MIELAGDRERRLGEALDELGRRGITSLLVEGGAELAGSLLDAGEVDELRCSSPRWCSAAAGRCATGGGPERIADARTAAGAASGERSGEDMLARARLREW